MPWPHGYERPTGASEPPAVARRLGRGGAGLCAEGKPHAVVHRRVSGEDSCPGVSRFVWVWVFREQSGTPRCGVLGQASDCAWAKTCARRPPLTSCARYRGVLSRPRVLEFGGKSWVYGTATRTHTRATPSLLTDVHSWRALFLQPLRSVEEATSSTYKTGCQSGHDKPYAVVTVIQKPEDVCCGPSKPRRRRWSG